MTTDPRIIHLIGAPSDVGASIRGSAMGPEALRVAGIVPALRGLGHEVTDAGNLSGPPNPDAPIAQGYRHLQETAAWCATVDAAVARALAADAVPVLLGGDHSLSIGSIGAVARHCASAERPLVVLWLDAHADFNTWETSPSGNIHGMPVAVLAGLGPDALTAKSAAHRPRLDPARDPARDRALDPALDPAGVTMLGVRSIDRYEKQAVAESGMTVHDMRAIDERGMRAVMDEALGAAPPGAHLHVSLDVDFLDPGIAPGVGTPVPGGPTYREAQLCMEMIHDSGRLGSVDVMELNPARDERNRTAELVVELIESLFGEQILGRHRAPRG